MVPNPSPRASSVSKLFRNGAVRIGRLLLCCFLTAVVFEREASSTVYYVRQAGDDGQDGTSPERAFATIQRAASSLRNAGDMVVVGPGLYREGNLTPARGGAPGRHVVFLGDPSGTLTGDPPGPVIVRPPPSATTGFLFLGRSYVELRGFTIEQAFDAGVQIRPAPVSGTPSTRVLLEKLVIRDTTKSGVDVRGAQSVEARDLVVEGSGTSGLSVVDSSSVQVVGGRVWRNGAHGIFVRGTADMSVRNTVAFSNGQTGITFRRVSGGSVVNNLVYANSESGIALGTAEESVDGVWVAFNTAYANGRWGLEVGGLAEASRNILVANNIFARNSSGGMAVSRPSHCGLVAGFNLNPDGYGPGTRRSPYDRSEDPLFVDPDGADDVLGGEGHADDDFHLQQVRGGQTTVSPAVDGGSDDVGVLGISGSTATGGAPDRGRADIGFHYGASSEKSFAMVAPLMPLFVSPEGDDGNTGLSPRSPIRSLAKAWNTAAVGTTVVVAPGAYAEGATVRVRSFSGPVSFVADVTGSLTGFFPVPVTIDAGGADTGFVVLDACGKVEIAGFDVTGARTAGIQVRENADGSIVRDNRVFGNLFRGIEVRGSDGVIVTNNAVFSNGTGGIRLSASRGSVVENNTVFGNGAVGILVGGDSPGSEALSTTVRANVSAGNGWADGERNQIQVKANSLEGYTTGFNVFDGNLAAGTPRDASDYVGRVEFANPPQDFALVAGQGGDPARDIDPFRWDELAAGSTDPLGLPDLGPADAGYHAPTLAFAWPQDVLTSPWQVVYVREAGNDENSGQLPSEAFRTVGRALENEGDPLLVVLGPGLYREDGGLTLGWKRVTALLGDETGRLTGDAPGRVRLALGERGLRILGRAIVDGVTVSGEGRVGVRISRKAAGSIVRNSVICGHPGLGLFSSAPFRLVNNLIFGNARSGALLRFRGSVFWTQILNNTIAGNGRYGVVVRESRKSSTGVVAANNITVANRRSGLVVFGNAKLQRNLTSPHPGAPALLDGDPIGRDVGFAGEERDPVVGCADPERFLLTPQSPAVDAGIGQFAHLRVGNRSAVAGTPDAGAADLGYHSVLAVSGNR